MKQITKKEVTSKSHNKNKKPRKATDPKLPKLQKVKKVKKPHPKFGTSKLEQDFGKNFLNKLGVEYQWQFEAKEIGRFFDFYIPSSRVIIEVDGDYWHGYGLVREEMNPTQKKNHRVDNCKDQWAALHGIPIIRIWEHDIRQNPSEVMKMLKEKLKYHSKLVEQEKEKHKRHVNKLDNSLHKQKEGQ